MRAAAISVAVPFYPWGDGGRCAGGAGPRRLWHHPRQPVGGCAGAQLFSGGRDADLFRVFVRDAHRRGGRGAVYGAFVGADHFGFCGALLVIRPDPANLDWVAFLPVLAGVLYAIGAVATRAWCEGEGTLSLTAGFFGMLALFGVIGLMVLPAGGPEGHAGFSLRGWVPLTPSFWFWTTVQAIGSLIGIGLIFRGYQLGEASAVAVLEYSLLVFASFWAWILWGDVVPLTGWIGMALIAVAGAVIAWRHDDAQPVPA